MLNLGSDRKAWRGGKEWNGLRLLRLCAMNELVVLNSFYQHKDIHKFTWESKGRASGLLQTMSSLRGAETGNDHYLVLMKVNLKLRKPRIPKEVIQPKLRVNRLEKKEVRWKFQPELGARFRQRRAVAKG